MSHDLKFYDANYLDSMIRLCASMIAAFTENVEFSAEPSMHMEKLILSGCTFFIMRLA